MGYKKALKGPTKEEKEAINKRKKFEQKWLNKHYYDPAPFKLDTASIGLKQLRFGVIDSHFLNSIQIDLDVITFKSSWIEFILLMLYKEIKDNPKNFKEQLGQNSVTNSNFCVEVLYGNYSFDGKGYLVYKIFDTGYYLELKNDTRVLYNAIVALIRLLNIDPAALRFNITSKTKVDIPKEEKLVKNTDNSRLNEVIQRLNNNEFMVYVRVLDETVEVHRLDVALLAICSILYDKYGLTGLMSIHNDDETGICLNELGTEYPCSRIRNSMLMVYTSGSYSSIITFINNIIKCLKLQYNDIEFGFEKQSKFKHEWEVD